MYSLAEIFAFINQHADNKEILTGYYNKCYESLNDLNKRSNLISFFILIIFGLFSFSNYVSEFSVLGFKISQSLVAITSPLLLSYFLLEWCLIARRRREMMKIVKHLGIYIFGIPAVGADYDFKHFSLHSRNIIPFSFMIEFVNIDIQSGFRFTIFRIILLLMFLTIGSYAVTALYNSFSLIGTLKLNDFKIIVSILLCNLLALVCLSQVVLFYIDEFKRKKQVDIEDKEFINQVNSSQVNQPIAV